MEVYQKKHRSVSWTLITLFPALKMKCVYNDKETKVDWYKPYGVIFSKYIDIYIVAKSAWFTEQDNSQDINAAHLGGGIHTCDRNTIQFNQKGNIQDLHFSVGKIYRNKNRFLKEIYNRKCWHFFSFEVSRQTSNNFLTFLIKVLSCLL